MQPEEVDKLLASYRMNLGRRSHIECQISMKNLQIETLKKTLVDDCVHTTSILSGMPRGTDTSDPTGRLAIAIADGYETDEIKGIRREIVELENELSRLRVEIGFVESWLLCLNDRERLIIQKQVIDGEQWRYVIAAHKSTYGEEYSLQGMKKIKGKALEKIYAVAA